MAAVGSDRTRKQKITIQAAEVDGTLTNYPLYVDKTHLDNEIISPSDSNRSQADGGDLQASSNEDGTTRIALEVVQWATDSSDGAGDGVIEVHILVPSVSSSVATDVWIWYNTPGTSTQPAVGAAYGRNAVWAEYEVVHHFNDNPYGGYVGDTDATGNNSSQTVTHTSIINATGRFGKNAVQFTSTQSMDTNWDPGGGFSNYSVQIMADTTATPSGTDYVFDNSDGSTGLKIQTGGSNFKYKGQASDGSWSLSSTNGNAASGNGWCNIMCTNNSSAGVIFYEDGVSSQTDSGSTGTLVDASATMIIGEEYDESSGSAVIVDEFRFIEATLSAAHVAAFESNTATPGTFAVKGTPETVSGAAAATPKGPFGHPFYGPFAGPLS